MKARMHQCPHPSGEESAKQRLDRNFSELLQELRVAQTGVQILLAFLLTMVFSSRFPTISGWILADYAAAVCFSTLAMGLLVAPVAVHRRLFRLQMKRELVHLTHQLTTAGLASLLAAVSCAVVLALKVALGTVWGVGLGALVATLLCGLWFGLPVFILRRYGEGPAWSPEVVGSTGESVAPRRSGAP